MIVGEDDVWVVDHWGRLIRIDPATNKTKVVKLRFDFGLVRSIVQRDASGMFTTVLGGPAV